MDKALKDFSEKIAYAFSNESLLKRALTHRSVSADNNERLEFLGDSVLGLIISQELFLRHPNATEGALSRMRANLVNGEILANIAKELDLSAYLHLGVGEQKTGGQFRHSILSDTLEAIIGAIYLDAGLESARACVLRWYGKCFDDLALLEPTKDPKSTLQEWLQSRKLPLPIYESHVTGEAHAQTFHVTCRVEGLSHITQGKNTSRRRAEQEAAQKFLELVDESKK